MKEKLRHIPEFDGIRGVAALMVMVFHFSQNISYTKGSAFSTVIKFAFFGQTGVTLFFILSGFLITRILLNSKSENTFFKPFYIRRSLRIFPLYFFFLFLYYFVLPFYSGAQYVSFSQQWPYWVYLQNFAITFNWPSSGPLHFWSLAVEEHFYLFWPLFVYFLSVRHLQRLIYAIVGIALILRFILFLKGYEVFYFTFTNIDSLALGGLLAIQEFKKDPFLKRKNFARLFFLTLIPTLFIWFFTSGKALILVQGVKLLLISVIYYACLGYMLCIESNEPSSKFFKIKSLRYAGKISYGLYVYHPVCFILLNDFYSTDFLIVNFLIAFLVSFLIASISYYAFEVHFLKLKKYFEYDSKEKIQSSFSGLRKN